MWNPSNPCMHGQRTLNDNDDDDQVKSNQVNGDYSAKQCEHFLQHSINSSGSRNQIQRTAQVGFQRRTKGNLF